MPTWGSDDAVRRAAERVPAILGDAAATEARLAAHGERSAARAHEGVWYLTA